MKFKIIILMISFIALQSCVPYKNIVYLQGDLPQTNVDSTSYKIKKDDILYISIKSSNESIERLFKAQLNSNISNQHSSQSLYFSGYTVDKNGEIELPVINKIKVEGYTFEDVKRLIKQKLLENQFKSLEEIYIKVKLAGVPYTVIGEVKTPKNGILYKTNPNIFDVLSDAKDITPVGNRKEVVVIRKENDKLVKKTLNLTDADIVTSPYFYTRPNDIIYIKPLRQKTWGTGTTLQQTISTTITALSLITTIILLSKYAN